MADRDASLILLKLLVSVFFEHFCDWLEKQHVFVGKIIYKNFYEFFWFLLFFPWIFISIYLEMTKICAMCWGRELGVSSVILLDTREYKYGVNVMYESHSKENLSSSVSKRNLLFIVSKNNDSKMVIHNFRICILPSFPRCLGWDKSSW